MLVIWRQVGWGENMIPRSLLTGWGGRKAEDGVRRGYGGGGEDPQFYFRVLGVHGTGLSAEVGGTQEFAECLWGQGLR